MSMNRKEFLASVRREWASKPLDVLQAAIEQKKAEQLSGKGSKAKDIHAWTLAGMLEVFTTKKSAEQSSLVAEQEQSKNRERINQAIERQAEAISRLEGIVGTKEKWMPESNQALPPQELLNAMGKIVWLSGDQEGSMTQLSEIPEAERLLMKISDKDLEFGGNTTYLAHAERDWPVTMVENAPMNPEWDAIVLSGRVAERKSIGEPIVADLVPGLSQNAHHRAGSQRDGTKKSLLAAIGGEELIKVESDILAGVESYMPTAADGDSKCRADEYWQDVVNRWPDCQRRLDNVITLKPPQSLAEAEERVFRYFDLLSTHPKAINLGKFAEVSLSEDQMKKLARTMMDFVPIPINRSAISKEFPHVDAQIFDNPNLSFAREAGKCIYLIRTDAYHQGGFVSSDLEIGREKDDLITKQRLAALVPDADLKNYKSDEWTSGVIFNTASLDKERFRKYTFEAKAMLRSCLIDAIQKISLSDVITDEQVDDLFYGSSWEFRSNGKSINVIGYDKNQQKCLIDLDEPDGLKRRISYTAEVPPKLTIHTAPSTNIWQGIALAEHMLTNNVGTRVVRQNDEKHLPVAKVAENALIRSLLEAMPDMAVELSAIAADAQSKADTTKPDWAAKLLVTPDFHETLMRKLGRHFTRIPPKSIVETVTRHNVLAGLIEQTLVPESKTDYHQFGLIDENPVKASQEMDGIIIESFQNRPLPVSLESNEENARPFLELFDNLGIEPKNLEELKFLREGGKMRFVCPKTLLPDHNIFHRSPEQDDEITLDLLAAALIKPTTEVHWQQIDKAINETIELQRGQWISGTLPTIEELESEFFQTKVLPERLLPPLDNSHATDDIDVTPVDGTGKGPEELQPIPRLKAVRNALLRLGLSAEFTLDERTSPPTSHQYGQVEKGHYVVVTIPAANMQLLVSDDRSKGTRVIYNTIPATHYTEIDITKLDEEMGRIGLRYNDADQFTSIVSSTIAQRLEDPSPVYPVGLPENRLDLSPLHRNLEKESRGFPEDERAIIALKRDFAIAAKAANKKIEELTISDFTTIPSEKVVWSFGGAAGGQAYLDRLAREFGIHDVSINEKEIAAPTLPETQIYAGPLLRPDPILAAARSAYVETLEIGPVAQRDFRSTVLKMILWELSPEYRAAQVSRAKEKDDHGRAHSMQPRRQRSGRKTQVDAEQTN